VLIEEEAYLAHYGILRKSGRYPWGSGQDQYTRNKTFLDVVAEHRHKDGWTDSEIAKFYGMKRTDLEALKRRARNENRAADIAFAQKLRDKGTGYTEIGRRMNMPESQVRAILKPGAAEKTDILANTADMLKQQVADKTYVDVGKGSHLDIGISQTTLNQAISLLKDDGYNVHQIYEKQLTAKNQYTPFKILVPPGVTKKDVEVNRAQIQQLTTTTKDFGRTWAAIYPPKSISPSRVDVVYGPDGGAQADGVIYVRRGVKDVSLGASQYAQVRILVGENHYLKGMAIYKDDLPDGIDLQFNTNKTKAEAPTKLDTMKKVKNDPVTGKVNKDNPFGSDIKAGGQIIETSAGGKVKVTSVMNKVKDEGDWAQHSNNLSSQMLSKQSPSLAREQLNKTYLKKVKDYEEISSLTNPEVKRKLLEEFADSADSSAVDLKAAALTGRQTTQVIMPIKSLPENQVYAPNFKPGERVALIRYPHAGTFEIPEVVVNNTNREAKKLLGDARDAIGINAKVAERLSGADFDGDFVVVIPNNGNKVKSTAALEGLKNFDAKREYKGYPGMKVMDERGTGLEMGNISNLITDMTIRKASTEEIARAVRHSMVVIDAEKHGLDWKRSERDNGIAALKERYQGGKKRGASTLISKANSKEKIPQRRLARPNEGGPIDPTTGKKVYVDTGKMRRNKDGILVPQLQEAPKLSLTDDAHTLSSGTPIEKIYGDHSNRLKALANQARLEAVNVKPVKYDASAAKIYSKQTASLATKLKQAEANAPRERQALILGNAIYRQRLAANPHLDKDEKAKIKNQAMAEARVRTQAKKYKVEITPDEWDAIQAGAISTSRLRDILNAADIDQVKALATPRVKLLMNDRNTAQAKQMLANGASRAEVAARLGVSISTLDQAING
jgi:transcriptional regulator